MSRWAPPDVISGAIHGEPGRSEDLLARVWVPCFRLAASITGDRALAQDAAQEACVIAYQKIRTLRAAEAFDTWLYRIVVREAARVRRRYKAESAPAYETGFEQDAGMGIDVWRALAQLSPPLREVTVLFYFDDLKSEEIADILSIPHATVRTRLARAREQLRQILGDEHFPSPVISSEVTQHAC